MVDWHFGYYVNGPCVHGFHSSGDRNRSSCVLPADAVPSLETRSCWSWILSTVLIHSSHHPDYERTYDRVCKDGMYDMVMNYD